MDYLRRRGLKTGLVYERRLGILRRAEVKRVIGICSENDPDPDAWAGIINRRLEENYLEAWHVGLFRDAGLPRAKSAVREMNRAKAADDAALETEWMQTLITYAKTRAGQNIVSVTGTLRQELIRIVREEMELTPEIGVEKLTKNIIKQYDSMARWQVRRIAQTETMIAMADAANLAIESLGVRYVKQWCISGLSNTRDSHEVMDGVTVDSYQPFTLAGGLLMYPHDTSLGAEAGEIINCACDCIRRPI